MKLMRGNVPVGRSARPGVVIVIMLLGLMLLASIVFYVFNAGRQVERRMRTQNAADAAAMAGAGTIARGLNTVAMNNVATARLIAMINVLDSLPMAIDFSVQDLTEDQLDDVEAELQAINSQLDSGVSDDWMRRMLARMADPSVDDSAADIDRELTAIDSYFQANPNFVPDMTYYNAPSGDTGAIWKAMYALDALSELTLTWLPVTAQESAIDSGDELLSTSAVVGQSLIAPVMPTFPWMRGVFDDYERPVRFGLLPGSDGRLWADSTARGFGQVDDTTLRRGPFDAVFGWRRMNGTNGGSGGWVPGPGRAPIPTGAYGAFEPTRYSVYGPHQWMQQRMPYYWRRGQSYDRVAYWVDRIAERKLRYLWRGDDTLTILRPEWEIDPLLDDERSNDGNDHTIFGIADGTETDDDGNRIRIRETMYVVTEIKSSVPDNDGDAADQGVTWDYINRSSWNVPFVYIGRRWRDPRNGPPFGIGSTTGVSWTQLEDYIWRASATYTTYEDSSIGLPLQIDHYDTDANGNQIPVYVEHTVYWEMDFLLVGINIGEDVEVGNPYAGFNRNASDAPAPYDFVHDDMAFNDDNNTSPYLEYLGVARYNNTPLFWPSRFGNQPYNSMVGVAEARVFNNHSRDLWTQMWHAQLVPVQDFAGWVDLLNTGQSDAADIPGLDASQLPDMIDYMKSIEPVADVMLEH